MQDEASLRHLVPITLRYFLFCSALTAFYILLCLREGHELGWRHGAYRSRAVGRRLPVPSTALREAKHSSGPPSGSLQAQQLQQAQGLGKLRHEGGASDSAHPGQIGSTLRAAL